MCGGYAAMRPTTNASSRSALNSILFWDWVPMTSSSIWYWADPDRPPVAAEPHSCLQTIADLDHLQVNWVPSIYLFGSAVNKACMVVSSLLPCLKRAGVGSTADVTVREISRIPAVQNSDSGAPAGKEPRTQVPQSSGGAV